MNMKKVLYSLPLLATTVCISPCALSTELDDEAIRKACTQTVNRYFIDRDQLNGEAVAQLFTADGSMTLSGKDYTGHPAIKDYVDGASPKIAHHLTTSHIDTGGTSVTGTHYVLINTVLPPQVTKTEQSQKVLISGKYSDVYRVNEGGCKFARRTLDILMVNAVN